MTLQGEQIFFSKDSARPATHQEIRLFEEAERASAALVELQTQYNEALNHINRLDTNTSKQRLAWDEGYEAGWSHAMDVEKDDPTTPKPVNPYRV